jgi:hypothetical protein
VKPFLVLVLPLLLLGCGGGGSVSEPGSVAPAASLLPVPVGAMVTQATPTSLSFQWESVNGAVDYRVARNSQQIILAEDTQSRFRDTDLTPGQTYNYTIEALGQDGSLLRRMSVSGITKTGSAELTTEDVPPTDVVRARSLTTMGWTPNPLYDTCPKWLHDANWTFGPDNKAYPTWHPPIYEYANGALCRFGHEHGQDQRESHLYSAVGPIPFGYVNEQLSPNDPNFQRNEDHFGHKIALFNGLKVAVSTATASASPSVWECDVLFKLHQGTHSADALKNNTHERFLNYKCPTGLEVRYKSLQAFGQPDTFTSEVANKFSRLVHTSGALPSNQPSGADRRIIPSIETMSGYSQIYGVTDQFGANCDNCSGTPEFQNELRAIGYSQPYAISLYNGETWQGGPTFIVANQTEVLFRFMGGPYWNLVSSSRYYAPESDTLIGRQIDLCFDPPSVLYNSVDCKLARLRGKGSKVAWDSPLSPFNGAVRFNEANNLELYNPSVLRERIYFTPFGQTALINNDLPLNRSATYPIRGYFKFTGANDITLQLSNWAGTAQCGGSACFTNFNFYKLKNGQVIDAGVHAPN